MSLELLALIICIFLSGFFSASEVAYFSLKNSAYKQIMKKRNHYARALYHLKKDPDKFIITVLVGNNLVNIAATVLATHLFLRHFGADGLIYATAIMTVVILIFGEIVPKEFAARRARNFIYYASPYFMALSVLLFPVIYILKIVTRTILFLCGVKHEDK
jgi:putative hemolysin